MLQANRRQLLGAGLAVFALGGSLRAARAQSGDNRLAPIFSDKDWTSEDGFLRYERLMWVTYELKLLYPDAFQSVTGLAAPDPGSYSDRIDSLTAGGLGGVASKATDEAVGNAEPSFYAALDSNLPRFHEWLGKLGIDPAGVLATDLLLGQALLALLNLVSRGYETLEAQPDSDDDDCAWFYPFC